MITLVLLLSLGILLLLNVPIGVSLGLATFIAIMANGLSIPLEVIPQKMLTSVDSFPFMAIPFFMFAGTIMQVGGISRRLINFAKCLVGSLPGGLGIISVFSSAFFGAISGSNAATVAAIGKIMIPSMEKENYPKDYASAVVASAGTLGVVVPPSVPMITYGVISGVSIGSLFLAGIVPALLMVVALSITIIYVANKHNLPKGRFSLNQLGRSFIDAIFAILMPVIVLGGIYGGFFTPTEAAAVACIYAIIITFVVYREIRIPELKKIVIDSGQATAVVFFVIATSSAFSWLLTSERIPDAIASGILYISDNTLIILLAINLLLLVFGVFLETNAIILLVTPILLPIAAKIGLDPLVLGIIMIVNTSIGMITPPMALNIVIASGISGASIEGISKKVLPFFIMLFIVVLVITYIPGIITFLPNLLGNT
ncbi:TRAP transporter large permease [Bacillus infantis]|uniref:TRAP transporter large permease n=1 Tax=Bacillus infantis TaxID=324767 RepID=UPI000B9A285D|nr:TRAP transporter large permease [Bacillus infantis]MCK6207053.1 TRAP transporter large permease [Bacillus infantis]